MDIKVYLRRSKNYIDALPLLVKEYSKVKFCGGGTSVTKALLLCHSLEKGMGIKHVKKEYGKEKAKELIRILNQLDDSSYAFNESVAVLQSYFAYQNQTGADISELQEEFLLKVKNVESDTYCKAGINVIDFNVTYDEKWAVGFKTFVESKHSLRDYSFERLSEEDIYNAIKTASRAPSACNRQPCRFVYSLDDRNNKMLAALIPGNQAFADDIPYYGLIVADRKMFGVSESFQWYTNGGIFASYLTLAFHSQGIGSCIFQWPDFYKNDKKAKAICGINDSEIITMAVGFGKYPDTAKCLVAQRKPVNEYIKEY